ncbi:LPS-assembly protein LptD [Malaciobacter pacificus]|uniref:Lipooligosaccharide transport system, OM translocon component LptD n=1 Tax=Malaciobacter pacificus TaxID=1080223 RepID=A0A5C2H6G1_9BACT|nr:LPS assembly protein LptD [Malaciobacter pacificus]QEP34551.1 lipooligosaccharide transport system, OM translocon component LptD [Malaciobacter pacificus]GGD33650.1 LPS-assembly protein LptD [Malaciobacter pacificus]
MHKKILLSLALASTLAFCKELKNEQFELIAENINTQNNTLTAKGNVIVYSSTYYLSADKIIYDKQSESFELFNNVVIIKDNNIQTQSDYAYLNLKDESYKQSPILIHQSDNNLWLSSKASNKINNDINLDNTTISSCNCINPAWSLKVSSATYDTKSKWIHAYNPRLYLGSVPILYSPYFGFPTDTTRRTGLLIPTLGYSNNEGLYYSQPIYFAPADNYDIEFIPQYRSQRGYGAYTYLRYVDSPYSILKMKTGGFIENSSYKNDYELENKKHYGWNAEYERTKLFSNEDTQDGFYASINYMNDIEYRTLENDDDEISTDKKVESKINYFYNTPKYYGGAYARYYIDTSKDNNDDTLQELPQLQFHKYNDSILLNNLQYSVDTKFYNYTRKSGITANIYELSLPISYTHYLLDDYLYITLQNKTTLSRYNYGNTNSSYENGTLIQNESSISLGSDLIKPYEDYLHTINLNANYSDPRNLKEDGDLYKITNDNTELESFPITQGDKNIKLSINQSLYKKDSLKQFINHKISQSILYENNNPKFQDLENYIKINHDFGDISNKTVYNIEDKQFIENDSQINLKYKDLTLNAGYYKSKESPNSDKEDLESYNFGVNYNISRDYKIGYYENYNLLEKVRNKQGVSFNINDNCWNLDLKYEREVVPSTAQNSTSIDQEVVFINLELKPLGGLKQKYKINENK